MGGVKGGGDHPLFVIPVNLRVLLLSVSFVKRRRLAFECVVYRSAMFLSINRKAMMLCFALQYVEAGPPPPPVRSAAALGKNIAVIGAGYSGLAAACELRLLGYEVTVVSGIASCLHICTYKIPVKRSERIEGQLREEQRCEVEVWYNFAPLGTTIGAKRSVLSHSPNHTIGTSRSSCASRLTLALPPLP